MLSDALAAQGARLISVCGAGGKTTLITALAREFAARGERVLVTTTTRMASDEGDGFHRLRSDRVPKIVAAASRLWGDAPAGAARILFAVAGPADGDRKLCGLGPGAVNALRASGRFDRVLVEADGSARRPLKACAEHEPVVPSATELLIAVAGLNAVQRSLSDEHVFRAERWASLTGCALGAPVGTESIALMASHREGFFKGCPPGARRTLFLNRAETPETLVAASRIIELLSAVGQRAPQRIAYGSAHNPPGVRSN